MGPCAFSVPAPCIVDETGTIFAAVSRDSKIITQAATIKNPEKKTFVVSQILTGPQQPNFYLLRCLAVAANKLLLFTKFKFSKFQEKVFLNYT